MRRTRCAARCFISTGRISTCRKTSFFVQDMLGLPVFDQRTGETVGTLREVVANPAHDMYIISREGKKDALIPACAPFLVEVDLDGGRIVVETIEGLLE